jgi:hypothetical protein
MTTDVRLELVGPTERNAEIMRTLVAEDFERMGLSAHDATERAFQEVEGISAVEWQMRRIVKNPIAYIGGFALGQLISFAVLKEHNAADQIPYAANPIEKALLTVLSQRRATNHLRHRPLGIPSILADSSLSTAELGPALRPLLEAARLRAEIGHNGEVRTQSYLGDPVLPFLLESPHAFYPGRRGSPNPGIDFEQTQYLQYKEAA